jgi:hypothetical protein
LQIAGSHEPENLRLAGSHHAAKRQFVGGSACAARTDLGARDQLLDAASSDAADAGATDAGAKDAVAAPYCATLAGPVASCDAGIDAGYVIECPAGTTCALFENDWCCCYPKFKACSCGSPYSPQCL